MRIFDFLRNSKNNDSLSPESTTSFSPRNFTEVVVEPTTDKKTVLVTGGAGFIGSATAMALLGRGDDVSLSKELMHKHKHKHKYKFK